MAIIGALGLSVLVSMTIRRSRTAASSKVDEERP